MQVEQPPLPLNKHPTYRSPQPPVSRATFAPPFKPVIAAPKSIIPSYRLEEDQLEHEDEIKRLYLENKQVRLNLRDLSEQLSKQIDAQKLST
jgi:hypothetical protein